MWEELGVDRIECLEAHWRQEPPVDVLVAHFLGFKPKSDKAPEAPTNLVPQGTLPPGVTEGKTELPPPPKSRLTEENVGFLSQLFPTGVIKPR